VSEPWPPSVIRHWSNTAPRRAECSARWTRPPISGRRARRSWLTGSGAAADRPDPGRWTVLRFRAGDGRHQPPPHHQVGGGGRHAIGNGPRPAESAGNLVRQGRIGRWNRAWKAASAERTAASRPTRSGHARPASPSAGRPGRFTTRPASATRAWPRPSWAASWPNGSCPSRATSTSSSSAWPRQTAG